jgi:predicted HD phosphohydrolase
MEPRVSPAATSFRAATAEDWEVAVAVGNRQYVERAGDAILALLDAQRDEPTNGWHVNNHQHSLQCATRALRDGRSEAYIVATLFHDVAQDIDPFAHDRISAEMLRRFVSDELWWMVAHHQIFQLHFRTHSRFDTAACESYRGHPHFATTLEFCEFYDQNCFDPAYAHAPLDAFRPMVKRVFHAGIATMIGDRYAPPPAAAA